MIDTSLSETTLSWDVVQVICRNTKVPVSTLHKPKDILCDYSQRSILVGAMVDLEVEFHGRVLLYLFTCELQAMLDHNPVTFQMWHS